MTSRQTLIMPLEDADPKLIGGAGGALHGSSGRKSAGPLSNQQRSPTQQNQSVYGVNSYHTTGYRDTPNGGGAGTSLPTSASPGASASYVGEASLDLQRTFLQQQAQQTQREVERLKAELREASTKLAETRQQLNEQKSSAAALTHRYSTTVEKLTAAESDVKRMEGQLVKERQQRQQSVSEREEQRLAFRELQWEYERVQRQATQLEASRGLDPAEVQHRLEDRSQFIPAVEVQRLQSEMQNTHQSLVDRLRASLDTLTASGEESQTNLFVARSSVLSAATDVEARLQRAEAALEDVDQQWLNYRDGLEKETHDFLLAVMSENKELWQQLTLLQGEYDVARAEVRLKSTQGGSVTTEEHGYLQHQLETMSERLAKAQKLVESQTILARAHESEMEELLEANEGMQRRVEELEGFLSEQSTTAESKFVALARAEAQLRETAKQVESLTEAVADSQRRAESMLSEAKATQQTMQAEYDGRARQLEHDCAAAEDTATTLQHTLEDTSAKLETVERNLQARTRELATYKQESARKQEADMAEAHAALQHVRSMLEAELHSLSGKLEDAQEAARTATRQREEMAARHGATTAAQRSLQEDVAHLQEALAAARRQLTESVEEQERAQAEAEKLRAACGEGTTLTTELRRRSEVLSKEKASLEQSLMEEKARLEKRYATLQADWRAGEKARATLQEEVKTLRTRCADLESSTMTHERQSQDKEQLMRENLRLHEQYQQLQKEATGLRDEVKTLRQRGEGEAQWTRQMEDLQRKLRELPELRQAADAARRDALTAKEETELLRKEKDQLARKLDTFLADAQQQSLREDDFERVCREASAAAQRVGGIVSAAKESGARYHVFKNTHPSGRMSGGGGGASSTTSPSHAVRSGAGSLSMGRGAEAMPSSSPMANGAGGVRTPRSSPARSSAAAAAGVTVQHRSPVRMARDEETSLERSATSSPTRPWR